MARSKAGHFFNFMANSSKTMTQDLHTAINILIVGMITVFIVLSLVVLTGRLLITIVNRWADKQARLQKESSPNIFERPDPLPSHIAAIVAAVDVVTQGRGHITNIRRDK